MDRIVSSSHDRTSLLSTHKVLRNTYFLLSLTLAFSAITATASTVLMLPSPGLILTLVGMYGLMFLTVREGMGCTVPADKSQLAGKLAECCHLLRVFGGDPQGYLHH